MQGLSELPKMIEVFEQPPMIDQILGRFGSRILNGVVFAWGNKIYNPSRMTLHPHLIAHESIHGARQGTDIEGWWKRYLTDPKFLLNEEILAHRAELEQLVATASNRHARRQALIQTAKKLSSPLYGRALSFSSAKKKLKWSPDDLTDADIVLLYEADPETRETMNIIQKNRFFDLIDRMDSHDYDGGDAWDYVEKRYLDIQTKGIIRTANDG